MKFLRALWLLACACVPGCGQMQQGYMKRGISQTAVFCIVLFIAVFLETGALSIFLVPLWLYSFFDTYNLRRERLEGAMPEDEYLFNLPAMDARQLEELFSRRHSVIGWTLVAVGLLILWRSVSDTLFDFLIWLFGEDDLWWLHSALARGVPRIVVTLLIMALGVWFIRGPKKTPPDSFPDFGPPEEEADGAAPFTAKGPYQPEAQVPMPLQLDLKTPEEQEADSHGTDR